MAHWEFTTTLGKAIPGTHSRGENLMFYFCKWGAALLLLNSIILCDSVSELLVFPSTRNAGFGMLSHF